MQNNPAAENSTERTATALLADIVKAGACQMLARGIESEVQAFVQQHAAVAPDSGPHEVRDDLSPPRDVPTDPDAVAVHTPLVRRSAQRTHRLHTQLFPHYGHRVLTVQTALPVLLLRGVPLTHCPRILHRLFGNAPSLCAARMGRLQAAWQEEYNTWCQRDLSGKRFAYVWADGIHVSTRLEGENSCVLVLIGADAQGHKMPLGILDGARAHSEGWQELLLQLRQRGLQAPLLAIGDGALGLWHALQQVYPSTRHQCCWMYQVEAVLSQLPKRLQSAGRKQLQAIWGAETRQEAQRQLQQMQLCEGMTSPQAVACLQQQQGKLLPFFDFPVQHWRHIRTTRLMESTFASVRLRRPATRGCLPRTTALAMVFQLLTAAQSSWKRLQHANKLQQLFTQEQAGQGERVQGSAMPTDGPMQDLLSIRQLGAALD